MLIGFFLYSANNGLSEQPARERYERSGGRFTGRQGGIQTDIHRHSPCTALVHNSWMRSCIDFPFVGALLLQSFYSFFPFLVPLLLSSSSPPFFSLFVLEVDSSTHPSFLCHPLPLLTTLFFGLFNSTLPLFTHTHTQDCLSFLLPFRLLVPLSLSLPISVISTFRSNTSTTLHH